MSACENSPRCGKCGQGMPCECAGFTAGLAARPRCPRCGTGCGGKCGLASARSRAEREVVKAAEEWLDAWGTEDEGRTDNALKYRIEVWRELKARRA